MANKSRLKSVPIDQSIKLFKKYYPNAHCALDHKNAYELLIATILSAQCTDERVNSVTKILFKKFKTPDALAKATSQEIEEIIHSTGFYKNKAKNIKLCAQRLVENFESKVPNNMNDLVNLPGVGRKTANVVLGNAFNISSGVVVDTHVTRLSNRMGWAKGSNAEKIEAVLNKKVPKDDWIIISHLLITHGRQICKARKPSCSICFLQDLCPKLGV